MINYDYVFCDDFCPHRIKAKGVYKGDNICYVAEDFMSLDTETSHNIERTEAWVYQWCFSYPQKNSVKRQLVYGRTPEQLADALLLIASINNTGENHKLNIYIHNLSYDYAYIKGYIEQAFGKKGSVLAIQNHNLITYEIEGLVFKCSFKLSLKSLDSWGKDLNITHKKLKGTIDYDVVRYQDSPLTKKDWKYMFYDIISLDECLTKQMQEHNDNLISIPLTNTGYIRRECRKIFRKDKKNRDIFMRKALTYDTYRLCRQEFAGGLTHGNRKIAGTTVKGCIRHRDFASHYPSQIMCYEAPSSKFVEYYSYNEKDELNINDLIKLTKRHCILATIMFSNLRLKSTDITLPYAQMSKILDGECDFDKINIKESILDNGRAIYVKGTFILTVNEHDLEILNNQYNFDYSILSVYTSMKGEFPSFLKETVMKFFYEKSFYKCELKRLEKEGYSKDSEEYKSTWLKMMIAKALLNSAYGMCATDPIRTSYFEDEDGTWKHTELTREDQEKALQDYYEKKNNFMNYELGCWTTSNARKELVDFAELIGYENFLYADTDSIFYISTPEIEEKIEQRNKEFREQDELNGWFIEVEGKKIYFNQFELEDEEIVEFRFLHSKCYAYVLADGELCTTIAGVAKYGRNNSTRVKELGNISELRDGKVFTDCGGTRIKYSEPREPQIININGHLTQVADYAIIMPVDKTLNDDVDRELLNLLEGAVL